MANKNTGGVEKLLRIAANEAFELKHDYVGTEHLLLALMKTGGIETTALVAGGANYEKLKEVVVNNIGLGDAQSPPMGQTPRVKRIFEMAREGARKFGHSYIGNEHILLALLDDNESFSNIMLILTGVDRQKVKQKLKELFSAQNQAGNEGQKGQGESNVEKFGKDLNQMAKDGKIDPVIGREKEIERIVQVLSRRTKNNPILIGEPGVGKTAIAEGLAQRIVEGNVPEIMIDKTIVSLDLPGMLAGTKYRGDFEERIKQTINELIERDNVVLFIDEFHTIIGAGGAEGAMDAANILKPVLARGELQIVGATTVDEYRKHIEKDAALERRLQPIMVEEPTVEDTIQILEGVRDKYEAHHKVKITDEALVAAAELSARYLTDRFLPDKAIDLIDEAASMIRVKNYVAPKNLKSLEDRLEGLNKEKEQAVATQNFEKAASLRDDILQLKAELDEAQGDWNREKRIKLMEVGFDEIAKIVSDWSGVPVMKMTVEESQRYLNLDKTLKGEVIGQDKAIDVVSHAIKRARVGLKDPNKPVGSFIFVGPTGVGKTYLAKSLARNLFGDEEAMIRIDMSEYMEKHSVSRLVGSPPGYVGYDEGGQLTEAIRRKPYAVVLFDEIEKAHPDVFNMLLQILDDGRITDSQGRTVSFKNAVIILTSNVGASQLDRKSGLGFAAVQEVEEKEYDRVKGIMMEELRRTFRPEFLNRIDDIVVFSSLDKVAVREITGLLLDEMVKRLAALEITISYTEGTVDYIADKGFDKYYGARPLERTIRTEIEDALTEAILSESVTKEDEILIDRGDEGLTFKKQEETLAVE